MINLTLDFSEVSDFQKQGYYFRYGYNHYLIEVNILIPASNCIITVYKIDIPKVAGIVLTNGVRIATNNVSYLCNGVRIATNNVSYLCELDIWSKYYLPKFDTSIQWYYNNDEISALAEVIKYSVKLGLTLSHITPL